MNVVYSVCVCSVIILCAQSRCLQRTWSGRVASRAVQGAIAEGGNGRFKGRSLKTVSAGIRGKDLT